MVLILRFFVGWAPGPNNLDNINNIFQSLYKSSAGIGSQPARFVIYKRFDSYIRAREVS